MMLYQKLADELNQLILQRVYCPGDKLPSIRLLSQQKKVSVATVQRALEELESQGIIVAKPKSGFYVCMPVELSPDYCPTFVPMLPKVVKIHEFASQIFHQCDDENLINLATSYPSASYSPTKQLQKIANKLIKTKIKQMVQVHFSSGDPLLREVLAKHLNTAGCRLTSDDLIVTNGCLEALSICLRAVAKPGDTIAIESPGFVGLLQLIESLGYQALEIPCHPVDGISLEALEFALERWSIKAVALVPTFSNPSGSTIPEASREKLVALLADKEVPLIEDDLFADLAFDGSRKKPCKAFDKKGLVLYCSSASKTIASGLRIGWIAPGIFYKEVSYFKTFTNISASNFSQMLVAEFLHSGRYERHLRQLTRLLAKQVYQFQQLITRLFPDGTSVSHPQGGSILWVSLPKQIDGYEYYQRAILIGIAIIPGQLSSTSNKYNHYIRVNCAVEPEIDIDACIGKLAELAHKMRNE